MGQTQKREKHQKRRNIPKGRQETFFKGWKNRNNGETEGRSGLFKCEVEQFAHELREQARKMVWSQTRSDMQRSSGDHIPHLVDVGYLEVLIEELPWHCKTRWHAGGVLRIILCNGVWTASSRSLLPLNFRMAATCPLCDTGDEESLEHLWWEAQLGRRVEQLLSLSTQTTYWR